MRYTKTMNETTPTDFELSELQAEIDSENETTQREIHSDCFGDDYADAMMKELGLWFLLWGQHPLSRILPTFTLSTNYIMFVSPTIVKSSTIRNIQLNPTDNQVIVQFLNNAKTYLYENVSADAIYDVIDGELTSLGKFVNAYCKGNESVTVG